MELVKGSIIKNTRSNHRESFRSTTANTSLTYEVTRVNPKTYTLKCIDGYMVGSSCNLRKDFQEESTDVYGTVSKWEQIR